MIDVRDNAAAGRFEAEIEGQLALAAYAVVGDTITFHHTEVPRALRGRGIASEVIRHALASARERRLKVVPACSFVKQYMDAHPETRDLLADR
jgi:predicted GNAT family acetyltransferase